MNAVLTRPQEQDLLRMLLIRHFELALLDLFAAGALHGTTHTCLGQEYVPVAVSGLLHPDDVVLSNHRGHGHYLARFDDPEGLLAEIMGRAGALCGGVGGSQHLYRPTFLSTGIQGENVTLATGIALHMRNTPGRRIAVVYTGDGTWGEGAVYEALNMAALWQVPLLIVVENNGIAQSTPTRAHMAGTVAARAAAFGVPHRKIHGCDVEAIRVELASLVDAVRGGGGPAVVEFDTFRLGPHSKGDDTRSPSELEALLARDWTVHYRDRHGAQYDVADTCQSERIALVVKDIGTRPLASGEAIWTGHTA
ncbi:thiamine pyrophosphate-dependent dehydrogenase E1 component subunit alpha [Nocardia sp. NPDC056100]|uniref:thiamine pyrophosphate-dependent dehydrogenase E1 component subunit alpha n=1 Tax=Nocardia sp. NPDC056100 TaxID=3345712 RepID=UPI0035DC53AD